MNLIQKVSYLFDLQSKLYAASQFIHSAAFFIHDITSSPKLKYSHVWKHIHINQLGDQIQITKKYKLLKKLMIITNASVIKQNQFTAQLGQVLSKIVFGFSFPRFFIDINSGKLTNHKFLRNPNIKLIKDIWNLPQNGLIKQLKKPFIFDFISQNIQFYVPRTKSTNFNNFQNRKYPKNLNIFLQNQNSIKIRLLNHQKLEKLDTQQNNKNNIKIYDKILIHFHGGGFIALSSCTSQTYTRKWANELKIPVFSVDYGKPPEYKFPIPLLDCLESYIFISKYIQKYFNIKPQKIYLAGDSAGGNLVCSLVGLLMKLNFLKPQGLLLVYPAVDTRLRFSPSRINSFNDTILYPTLLLLCLKQYLGNNEYKQFQNHPLASPILLTQQYVKDKSLQDKQQNDQRWPINWPKTIIMVGKKDPLYDDSIRLCQKLCNSQIQFHCQLYQNLTHAFLSINTIITQCNEAIKDSIKFLTKLIQGQKLSLI